MAEKSSHINLTDVQSLRLQRNDAASMISRIMRNMKLDEANNNAVK